MGAREWPPSPRPSPPMGARECNASPRLSVPIGSSGSAESGQDDFVAGAEGDDGFLPVFVLAGLLGALAAEFAPHIESVYPDDLDLEEFLDGLADLEFVGAPVGHDGVLVELRGL